MIWFLTVSTLVSLLGSKFNEKVLNIINKVCGAVIIFYGGKLLWSFVKMMGWLCTGTSQIAPFLLQWSGKGVIFYATELQTDHRLRRLPLFRLGAPAGQGYHSGKLEAVLGALQGAPVNVIGAGRTDAGVHARAMTANVVLDVAETPDAIRDYLNRYLPDAIAVREVKEAAPRFHARYNALGKTYRYTCHIGPVKPVFDRKYVTLLDYDPDVEKMRQAAAYLLGENDFASFCGNPRMKKSTVRLVDHIAIERRKDRVVFTFHGTGFLQNMVRIMVGTLLEVGRGYWTPEQVREILSAKDRKQAGPTAPPEACA